MLTSWVLWDLAAKLKNSKTDSVYAIKPLKLKLIRNFEVCNQARNGIDVLPINM